jgi:hypothetical protein
MAVRELHLHELLGQDVTDVNGASAGRIEEVCAERRDESCYVTDVICGTYGLLARLAGAGDVMRTVLRMLPGVYHGYRIRWDLLDLSDTSRPRVTVAREALPSAGAHGATHSGVRAQGTGEEVAPRHASKHGAPAQ